MQYIVPVLGNVNFIGGCVLGVGGGRGGCGDLLRLNIVLLLAGIVVHCFGLNILIVLIHN